MLKKYLLPCIEVKYLNELNISKVKMLFSNILRSMSLKGKLTFDSIWKVKDILPKPFNFKG